MMEKPKIWLYWDNIPPATESPAYIQLCLETIRRHCQGDFDIHMVTTENVRQFLPNISDTFFQISQINNRSNYLRYMLLREHGGIWLDSDLILFKSLKPLYDFLKDGIDLVATASPGLNYGEPECGFLLSTQRGEVISKAVSVIEYQLNLHSPKHIFTWGSLGPATIRQAVKGKKYHHLDYRLLMQIPSWEAFRFDGKESIDKYCSEDSLGTMLFHQMFKQGNSQSLTMNREQLLESSTLLGQMFRKAMGIQT
ncbi:hypothetical protein LCGC14_0141880 [marine sediment metagenome]|uniref:Alpha 1,4-glycosyltransferase domain-containing protein n=1 Tax=marine sediment metagenome TaxID=412755 RepID=A0A0F9Y2R1_9ZZZZ